MATDVERLIVSLEANIKKYERELARSRGVTETALRDVERSVSSSAGKIEGTMARVGSAIRGGIAVALAGISVGKLVELSDSFTKVQNALKVNGLEGEALAKTYRSLFDLAQKQGVPLQSLSEVYSKAAMNQKGLSASSEDLIGFTNAVAVALRAGGVSAVQADQALQQLGQALGSGKVQWEELESVTDSAPTIMQAAAAGIKEAGGDVGVFTKLVRDGKVSSEALFRGITAGLPHVQSLADKTKETSSQGIARLNNALIDLWGEFEKAAPAAAVAVEAMTSVAGGIRSLTESIPGAIDALSGYFEKLSQAPYFQSLVKSIAASEGGDTPADAASPFTKPGNRLEGVFASDRLGRAGSLKGMEDALRRSAAGQVAAPKATTKQISLADFKVPGEKDKKGGGGSKEKENDLQRETAAIVKRTGALENELTTVGKSAGAAAEAEAKFKLLEAAKKANVAVTPALMADIEKTAAAFGVATEKLEQAEAANRKFEAASRQAGATLSDAFSDAIVNGEKLTEVLNRLVKSLATRGIDSIFETLFSKGGAGNNLLGGLLKGGGLSLNPTGRASGGPVKAGVGYDVGESGRERFVPTSPGRIISNRKLTGGRSIRMGDININAPGADPAALMGLRAYVDQARAEDRRLIGQSLANWRENN